MNADFVPFELAVKLKEKGFRELCLAYYTNDDTLYYNYSHKAGASYTDCYLSHNLMPKDSVSGKFVDAPTISQVLKWLREEKKIYLELVIVVNTEYMCDIYKIDERPIECLGSTEYFKTPEQAALAGIEYVLDNLI